MKTYSTKTDEYEKPYSRFVEPAELKPLVKLKQWRGVLQLFLEWVYIFLAVYICEKYFNIFLYIFNLALIGGRQIALASIMHEGVHNRLLSNKKLNDWIGEIFAAWPILMTLNGYRQTHFAHHRNVNKAGDPDWEFTLERPDLYSHPKTKKEILFITLKYWLGYYIITDYKENNKVELPSYLNKMRFGFYGIIILTSIIFHFWQIILLYWVVPLSTYLVWAVYIREVSEHSAGLSTNDNLLENTRHMEPTWIERIFITPNNTHIHIAHHLYPSVPFYNLPKLHEILMKNPNFAYNAHITKGYWGLIKEWSGDYKTS